MVKRTFGPMAGFILMLLPTWPITENFFPPENQVDDQHFSTYLLLCSLIILFGLGLVFFLKPRKILAGWLLFAVGMTSIFPLHLGPPRENADLLKFSYIEQLRYSMLLFAVLLFFVGCYKAAGRYDGEGGFQSMEKTSNPIKFSTIKLFLVFLIVATVLNIWDNYSSLMFSTEMQKWKDNGKDANVFFDSYDYHMLWRTLARVLLYLVAAWLSILLVKRAEIRTWQFIMLMVFNIIGVLLCTMSLLISPQYYFPFMVPAIAMAPAYWIGLMLLCNKQEST